MKQKAALLAAALRSSDQVKQFPHGKGKLRKVYLYATTSVPIAETGQWRNEGPHRRGASKGSKKFSRPSTERHQPEPTVQNLFSLAGAESDQERPGSLILGPWEPRFHNEIMGPINDFYGGYQS